MAWSYIGQSNDLGANLALTIPAGYQEGDLLVIVGNINLTFPAGWTDEAISTNSTADVNLGWKVAGSSESTVNFSNAGSSGDAAVLLCYRGLDASPFDVKATGTGAGSPTVTTTRPNDLVISAVGASFNSGTWSALNPTGPTLRFTRQPGNGFIVFDKNAPAAGSVTGHGTNVGSGVYAALTVAFREPSVAANFEATANSTAAPAFDLTTRSSITASASTTAASAFNLSTAIRFISSAASTAASALNAALGTGVLLSVLGSSAAASELLNPLETYQPINADGLGDAISDFDLSTSIYFNGTASSQANATFALLSGDFSAFVSSEALAAFDLTTQTVLENQALSTASPVFNVVFSTAITSEANSDAQSVFGDFITGLQIGSLAVSSALSTAEFSTQITLDASELSTAISSMDLSLVLPLNVVANSSALSEFLEPIETAAGFAASASSTAQAKMSLYATITYTNIYGSFNTLITAGKFNNANVRAS